MAAFPSRSPRSRDRSRYRAGAPAGEFRLVGGDGCQLIDREHERVDFLLGADRHRDDGGVLGELFAPTGRLVTLRTDLVKRASEGMASRPPALVTYSTRASSTSLSIASAATAL
jgi:hypothetical protein